MAIQSQKAILNSDVLCNKKIKLVFHRAYEFSGLAVYCFQNQAKITAERDCGLAEWIIDDSSLVIITLLRIGLNILEHISIAIPVLKSPGRE